MSQVNLLKGEEIRVADGGEENDTCFHTDIEKREELCLIAKKEIPIILRKSISRRFQRS